MDYRLLMDTAVLAGEIMLGSGAETYRVEDTVSHFLKTAKLKHTQAFATGTGVFAMISDPGIDAIMVVRRVEKRSTNLNKIYMVNNISRQFSNGEISLEEAFQGLKQVRVKTQYSLAMQNIGIVLTAAFFTLLLGGTGMDALVSAVVGVMVAAVMSAGNKIGLNGFIRDGLISAVVVLLTMLFGLGLPFPIDTSMVIIGGIMPLVPGVAITNAIRDTLQGDYVSGGARMLEAFVQAAVIAMGASLGIAIFSNIF